ncbi:hypothetical protein [Candidatus Thiodictyon syntrophicum]|jgi:hypothetical protein|uniref:Helicase XPB/Ssl2 N-terminal domain-containing protein n=1 Tax=Candidatus Thiodictyon syntrophicum TaxID=1166950 RepID=A0A2K8U7Q9_9GAMM|nr:hypothetical protein [Candidatus Thiodictyon syntrophicum]AUB81620.1 hypothetical protein THSYN_12060 [Candidatus Thiodictyon syntrophicum]
MNLHETLEILTASDLKLLRKLTPIADRSTRKGDLVAALAHYLLSGDLGLVWGRLSELEVQAIAEAVHCWGGSFDAARFGAKYGAVPGFFQVRTYWSTARGEDPEPPSVLPLFFYQGEIPEDLRPRLAALTAPPTDRPIATLTNAQLPATLPSMTRDADGSEPLRRVDTEDLVRHDLPAVLRLIGQGAVAVGAKTGLPGSAAVARLEAVLLGGDWYAAGDDQGTERWAGGSIRPIRPFAWPLLLQAGGLAKQEGGKLTLTPRGNKALSQPLAQIVPHLFERWQLKGAPDELRRVDLIKGQTAKGARMSAPAERRQVIAAALRDCPVGLWIDIDEFFRYMQARGHSFAVTDNPWGLYLCDPQYGSLGRGFAILEARYCLAYLFEYLATLGMIDVAYTLPYFARADYSGAWGTDEFQFLSRYDGLRFIRINPLGAFCLGLATDYRPAVQERRPLFTIGPDLGLTLLRAPEPGERLLLERVGKPSSADLWVLEPDAVLSNSADPAERDRIRDFIESAADAALPPQVRHLLDSVGERAGALADAGPARLIRCRDPAIAAMLASDPVTAPHCTRAGERLICVLEPKLAAFRKGLAKLGFVFPETARG